MAQKTKITWFNAALAASTILLALACSDYLDEKPRQSLVVPRTLDDLEALLNNNTVINEGPSLAEIVADDYYVTDNDWNALMGQSGAIADYYDECLNYIWDARAEQDSWSDTYRSPVFYANTVLDVLAGERFEDRNRADRIKGAALFYRGFAFLRLAQVYAPPYGERNLEKPGLVLRTTADIGVTPIRSTVGQTYGRIISDLEEAAALLPDASEYPTQPTRAAALAALARAYLSMCEYGRAGEYADRCLTLRSGLLDYNDHYPARTPVFPEYNTEVIFHSRPSVTGILGTARAKISPELLETYGQGDLRRQLYFLENTGSNAGTYRFRGNYMGRLNAAGNQVFDGLTTGELYLTRAECRARAGDVHGALEDLNTLARHRWTNDGSWRPFAMADAGAALDTILSERRRELVFRALRWTDLRRLNEEGRAITLSRHSNGETYTLPPGDPRWVMLIPSEAVNRSGLTQNPR